MKRIFLLLIVLLTAAQAHAAVGVSVSVGQPGFYGQIDIGDYAPQPQVIYTQPVIIESVPVYSRPAPIYLHVPPGHAKRWSTYCGRYNACGVPVYFVQNTWYNDVYVPKHSEYERGGHDNDRHDDSHDYHGSRGKGHDKGHDNGHGHDRD